MLHFTNVGAFIFQFALLLSLLLFELLFFGQIDICLHLLKFIKYVLKCRHPQIRYRLFTLALFYAVGRWNGYSDALLYMKKPEFYPLQLLLYNIINNINSVEVATQEGFSSPGLSASLKAAIVMFSTIPILCVYPWLQKYFIHGVTMGAVKE